MANQISAASIVVRVMGKVENALKSFDKLVAAHKKSTQQMTKQTKKHMKESEDFGTAFMRARQQQLDAEVAAEKKAQAKITRDHKRALDKRISEAQAAGRKFMSLGPGSKRFTQANIDRARAASMKASGASFRQKWWGSNYGHEFINSPLNKLRRFNSKFVQPKGVYGPSPEKPPKLFKTHSMAAAMSKGSINHLAAMMGIKTPGLHPMAAAMGKSGGVHSMAAMMSHSARHLTAGQKAAMAVGDSPLADVYRRRLYKFVQPKGEYGPSRPKNWNAMQRARRVGETLVPGMFTAAWQRIQNQNAARAVQETIVPRGMASRAWGMVQARRVGEQFLPHTAHQALRNWRAARVVANWQSQNNAAMGPGVEAARAMARAKAVKEVTVPRGTVTKAYDKMGENGQLGAVRGTVRGIARAFKEASTAKDGFSANVFAKMPPCVRFIANVARTAWSIGAWGFSKAVSGISTFIGVVAAMPGKVAGAFRRLGSYIRNSVGNLQALGTKLRTAGIYTTAALTLPLAGAAKGAVNEGSNFDKAMVAAQARAGIDANGKRKIDNAPGGLMDQMKARVRSMALSGTTTFSSTELAQGYKELAAAGVEAKALMDSLPIVAILAQDAELGLAETTNYLTTTLGAFNKTSRNMAPEAYAKEMKRASDVMVTVSNLSQASVESVAKSMTTDAAPAARQYGMSIEQLGAILGAYAEGGKLAEDAGNMAGRGFRLMQNSFLKHKAVWSASGVNLIDKQTGAWVEFSDAILMLDKAFAGMKQPQIMALMDKMGIKALQQKAILPLLGKGQTLKDFEKAIAEGQKGKGSSQVMAENLMESFEAKMLTMWSAIKEVQIEVFNTLRPYLEFAAEKVTTLAKAFLSLPPATKKSIIVFLAALAMIGPVLVGFGTIIALAVAGLSVLGTVLAPIALLLSPAGILIGGLMTLATMFVTSKLGGFAGMWNLALSAAKQFSQFVEGFTNNFGTNMEAVVNWLGSVWQGLLTWVTDTFNASIKAIQEAFPSLTALWKDLVNVDVGSGFMAVVGFFVNLPENIEIISNSFSAMWDRAYNKILAVSESIGKTLTGVFIIVGQALYQTLVGVIVKLYPVFRQMFAAVMVDIFAALPGGGMLAEKVIKQQDAAAKNLLTARFFAAGGANVAGNQEIYDREWEKIEKSTKNKREKLARGEAVGFAGDFMEELGRASIRADNNPVDAIGKLIHNGMKEGRAAAEAFDKANPVPAGQGLNLNVPDFQGPQLDLEVKDGGFGLRENDVERGKVVALLGRIAIAVESDDSLRVKLSNMS